MDEDIQASKMEPKMQDGVAEENNDEESLEGSKPSQDLHQVTIDFSEITSCYQDISPLGCGANALIFSAIDQQCRRRLAVKKVSLKQRYSTNSLKRLFREIRILRRLDNENVVGYYHTLVSARPRDFGSPMHKPTTTRSNQCANNHVSPTCPLEAVYIGMELMDTDLQHILSHRSLSPNYTKLFMYQLLRGLKYIHSANVLHRDITPSNIFINIDTLMLKIGDFGVSRVFDEEYDHTGHLSMTSTTTKYQAPELILHPRHYSTAVDIWAAGCVFAEMLSGKPLFSGENAMEQIEQILHSISVTSANWRSVAEAGCQDKECCSGPEAYGVRDNGGQPSLPLHDLLPNASPMAVNLLRQMLTFDPTDRITATDALMHPFLSKYAEDCDEPVCAEPFRIEDELDDFSIAKYQELLLSVASNAASLVSTESAMVETSNEDSASALRTTSNKQSNCTIDSSRDVLALVHSSNPSVGSMHNPTITMSESEARTMACDFDYGVQITDGSVNRERLCLDFAPIRSNSACFDPYKWDTRNDNATQEPQTKVASEIAFHKTPNTDGNHSDHGYHSSYCSSNFSHGKVHPNSMWSLSSPDVSIDTERSSTLRATTPDNPETIYSGMTETEDHVLDNRHSPNFISDDKTSEHCDNTRRHKDGVPRHHQSFGHHSHYHHHHHHHHSHHHHHKHHRHSSRHATCPSQSHLRSASHEADSNPVANNVNRCHQRRCVVTDTVPEAVEESITLESCKVESSVAVVTTTTEDSHNKGTANVCVVKKLSGLCKSELLKQENPNSVSDISNNDKRDISKHDLPTAVLNPPDPIKNGFTKLHKTTDHADRLDTTSLFHIKDEHINRSRTKSDGSQFKRPDRGLVSTIQNGLNQFCFGGLLKKSASQNTDCASGLHCQPVNLLQRIRVFSGDRTVLNEISESMAGQSQALDQTDIFDRLSSPPAKCSSASNKPATIPRKRVECPF